MRSHGHSRSCFEFLSVCIVGTLNLHSFDMYLKNCCTEPII